LSSLKTGNKEKKEAEHGVLLALFADFCCGVTNCHTSGMLVLYSLELNCANFHLNIDLLEKAFNNENLP
jgi:hypothetical protein